jgi:DNA-binding NarL/FixJ family response regulator
MVTTRVAGQVQPLLPEREEQALDDDPGPASSTSEGLTKRELEVLVLLVQELTYLQIAQQMGLQVTTINTYVQSIYRKLGVRSRVQALRRAMQLKLI